LGSEVGTDSITQSLMLRGALHKPPRSTSPHGQAHQIAGLGPENKSKAPPPWSRRYPLSAGTASSSAERSRASPGRPAVALTRGRPGTGEITRDDALASHRTRSAGALAATGWSTGHSPWMNASG